MKIPIKTMSTTNVMNAFFDLDGENGEAAMVAYMKANSLLGTPLETLAERPVRLLVAIETHFATNLTTNQLENTHTCLHTKALYPHPEK